MRAMSSAGSECKVVDKRLVRNGRIAASILAVDGLGEAFREDVGRSRIKMSSPSIPRRAGRIIVASPVEVGRDKPLNRCVEVASVDRRCEDTLSDGCVVVATFRRRSRDCSKRQFTGEPTMLKSSRIKALMVVR